MELKQKRVWDKRHFKLLDDGVWLRIKTPTEDAELKYRDRFTFTYLPLLPLSSWKDLVSSGRCHGQNQKERLELIPKLIY